MNESAKKLMRPFTGDVFRRAAPTIVSFYLILLSQNSGAQVDAKLSAFARSYPQSGVVELETGYGYALWGSGGGDNIMYGFLRPHYIIDSSYTYNSVLTAVDVFPISFFGFRGGGEYINNSQDYVAYDCNRWNCQGVRLRSFAEAEVSVGNKQVFGRFQLRREKWSQNHELEGDFIDPTSGLAVKANGDSATVWTVMGGVAFKDQWRAILGTRYAEMANIHGVSQFTYVMGQYKYTNLTAGLGLGTFKSALKARDVSLLFTLSWELLPSIALD